MDVWLINFFQLEGLQFANPIWLWTMFLWPILWLFASILQSLKDNQADDLNELQTCTHLVVKHALIDKMELVSPSQKTAKERFSFSRMVLNLLRGCVIISLSIALAQPERIQILDPLPQQNTVRDIVFVIESSASLLLPDYQINNQSESRMNVVKSVLDQFISGLEGNRFGLTIYADNAYTLMPLTSDQTAARFNLKRLKPHLAGRLDTAMGEALGLALKQTDESLQPQNSHASGTLKRVVVLISDGLSKPSRLPISEAINYAQMMQVPIYTIGVGSSNQSADQRLYTGLLYQPLESQTLQTIAKQTKGQYFQIGSGADLGRVLQKINQAEGVPTETPPRPPLHTPLYDYPLSIGVMSLFIYLLLSLLLANRIHQSQSPSQNREGIE